MPTISVFYGIIIKRYYADHNPSHFHAYYQDSAAVFSLDEDIIDGEIPTKQKKLIAA